MIVNYSKGRLNKIDKTVWTEVYLTVKNILIHWTANNRKSLCSEKQNTYLDVQLKLVIITMRLDRITNLKRLFHILDTNFHQQNTFPETVILQQI